jgi:hypothetical protein
MSRPPAPDAEELLSRGQALLAGHQALDAIQVFADAHAVAVGAGDRGAAARAMLGQAQAEFAVRRLSPAAEHAATALDLFTALAMPQARHAADLLTQIDHNRYLG